jgi:hypothetical protein
MKNEGRLLAETLPKFSAELTHLLEQNGEPELARQVTTLRIVKRCSYDDDFCSSFYTQPKPSGAYGPNHRNVALRPTSGDIILDVVNDQICFVEVLCRDDVRAALKSALGWF